MRPRDLPKLRDQTLRHLDDPTSALRANTGGGNRAGLDVAASHLRAADLYWVAPDMVALAVSAGASLAAARWAVADRPTPCGLLVWDQGAGHIDSSGVQIPVEACSWGPGPGGLLVWLWMSRRRLGDEMTTSGLAMLEDQVPPLIPLMAWTLPVTAEPVPLVELPDGAPAPVFAALASAWLLMQQPQLVERMRERADKSVRAAYARAQRPDPTVTVIDLRRLYVPDVSDKDAGDSGRHYRHRWVVSGHWRNQPHGPGRALRRQIWIPAYVKGPDGAPLLATEKVNVWRR